MRRGVAGFTVLELLTVMTVLGILAAIAIPGFGYLAASTRVKGASTELYLALVRARSEAVKRNRSVTVRAVSGDKDTWNAGWQIIADANNDGDYDDVATDNDRLIVDQGTLRRISITAASDSIIFRPTGRISGDASAAFEVTAEDQDRKVDLLRCVRTDLTGRPYVKPEACT